MTSDVESTNPIAAPSDSYVCLARSRADPDFWSSPRDVTLLILLLLPLLVVFGTQTDGTFNMYGDAKGLRQHYGFWIIFLSTPVLVSLASALVDRCAEILSNASNYLDGNATDAQRERLIRLTNQHIESLCLRTSMRYVLYFCVLVGLAFFVLNVIKTCDPYSTYGHDVFDAWSHQGGYITAKLYLLPVVLLVYPVALFICAHVTWSMVRMLRFLCTNRIMEISYFHEDNCGGTSCFGELNLYNLAIYTLLFAVMAGMMLTHERTYFVMRSALIFCTIATTAQSLSAVWAIHSFISLKKKTRLKEIAAKLDTDFQLALANDAHFRNDLLAARNHIQAISTFPYAARIVVLVNAIRFAPVIIAIITFVR